MFTGIVEATGKVLRLEKNRGNLDMVIQSPISSQLKIDQSVSHNGVCLTVVKVTGDTHRVTAIDETLQKTNLAVLIEGDELNLERCTKVGERLDGHIVQGHVDQTGECIEIIESNGSWVYQFRYLPSKNNLVVEKGSVCINGISLTAFETDSNTFKVAIIPYTFEHTNIRLVQPGSFVNLEFDIIGKYVARMMEFRS